MKKVGIMSMQRIYNYGSFLQAYGLKRIIESLDNEIQVSFIDYVPGEPLVKTSADNATGVKRVFNKIKEYSNVDTSISNKLKVINHKRTYAKRFYPLLGISAESLETSDLDTLVIGSDEVFNCVQANTNVGYSRDLFGHTSKSKKIISYAASFGNTTKRKIEEAGIKEELTSDFSSFNAVSVRDENSLILVKQLGVRQPSINVDPVLAYDYMHLENQIPQKRMYEKEYIVVYGYSGRLNTTENKVLKTYAESNGLKILCFGGVQTCCDEFIDCNPFELLAYFRDAEFIVTDTFHGSIFSIINKKSFITLIRKSIGLGYGNEEKLGYLLDMLGLSGNKIYELTKQNLVKAIHCPINYESVTEKINMERKRTRKFLRDSI